MQPQKEPSPTQNLENSPQQDADIFNSQSETCGVVRRNAYQSSYRLLLVRYSLGGLLSGQLLSLLTGAIWPLTPILGALLGLGYAYKKVWRSLGDLTDWQIALLENKGVVTPFNINQVEPDSYDVLLGTKYTRLKKGGQEEYVECDQIVIQPNECLLAHTIESFNFPEDLKGTLQGKSSWARLSLFVECAGLFDKGFKGTAVLELFNASPNPILLKKGDKIAQMSFHRTLPATIPYGSLLRQSHYQLQEGAKISWLTKKKRIVQ
jgi:deoxycytidine triphosphate deaminase